MPQLDVAHNQGRRVAPSMRQSRQLPAHAGKWDSTRPAGRRQRRRRIDGRYGASQQRPCDHPSSSFSFAKFSALGLTLPLSQREITA